MVIEICGLARRGSSVVEQMTENHCVESPILSPGTNMDFKGIIKLIVLILIAFAAYNFVDGYIKIEKNKNFSSFILYSKEYVRNNIKNTEAYFAELKNKINNGITNNDEVRENSMNKIAEALELYKAGNEFYPADIYKLKKNYIDTKVMNEPDFKYAPSQDKLHYEMSIVLSSGKKFLIKK